MNKLYIYLLITFIIIIITIIEYYFFYDSFDVKIHDENKPTYNIGDILNMPSYFAPGWEVINSVELIKFADKITFENNYNINIYIEKYPNSILYNYYTSRPTDEMIPNVERIISSTDEFIKNNHYKLNKYMNIVSNNNTLTVHIRSGDKGVIEDDYIEIIKKLSNQYERIFVLSGIHKDNHYLKKSNYSIDTSINNTITSLDKLNLQNVIYNSDEPDVHLSIMRTSSNLLIHKGGFSLLGGLLFKNNNLYISPFLETKNNPTYTNHLKGNVIYL